MNHKQKVIESWAKRKIYWSKWKGNKNHQIWRAFKEIKEMNHHYHFAAQKLNDDIEKAWESLIEIKEKKG